MSHRYLDTRGFMDGALRGFDVMDRHLARKESAERLRDRDAESDRRYWAGQAKDDERYQAEQTRLKGIDDLNKKKTNAAIKANEAQLAASTSTKNLNEWRAEYEKRQAFVTESMPVLQSGWDRWQQTGELDPIFDNEHIKGRAYDPRRYTQEHFQAAKQLKEVLPKIGDGDVAGDAPELIQPLSVFYKENIKTNIGQKDPNTGKIIADKELLAVNPVHDVDPDTPGDQPGLVLTLDVFYDDNTKAPRPVTTNRGTDPSESVMVVPMKKAMADLAGQMKLAETAYQRLFTNQNNVRKDVEGYRAAMLENDKWYASELSRIDGNVMIQDKESARAQLQEQYQARGQKINTMFGLSKPQQESPEPEFTPQQWAGTDPQKQAFLEKAGAKVNLGQAGQEQLDQTYAAWRQTEEARLVAKNIRETDARLAQN